VLVLKDLILCFLFLAAALLSLQAEDVATVLLSNRSFVRRRSMSRNAVKICNWK